MTRYSTSVITIALFAQIGLPAFANEKVYQRGVRGTVMIIAGASRASGVLVDKEKRLIVTANHVTSGQSAVDVVFPMFSQGGEVITDARSYSDRRTTMRGRVISTDQARDVSVIQVDQLPEKVEAIPLAKSSPRPGQDIHCIGNAAFRHGGLFGYSYGKVRNVFRRTVGGQLNGKMIVETQIPTNKGDSGGPIFNDDAELVAIVSQGTTGITPPQNDPFHALQVVDHSVDISEIRVALANPGGPANTGKSTVVVFNTSGDLKRSDTLQGNRYVKVYTVKLDAGVTYTINLMSGAFDTYLKLEDAKGKQIAENDDGGNNTDSRMEYSPNETGEYRLVVTSYRPLSTGAFSLEVEKQ